MLGRAVRIIFALTALAPVSVSLAYVYFREDRLLAALCAAFVCLVLAFIAHWVIIKSGERLERLPISLVKAKSADKEVIGFVIAYALPLIFKGDGNLDLGSWLLAGIMLVFVLLTTHTLLVNPVLGLLGFHFYEVETKQGVTYLLITRRQINNILSVDSVVQLSEYGLFETK